MLSSWFSSKSSRHRKTPSSPPPAPENAQSGPSDASSVSQSTARALQTPDNQLDDAHAHINDPSVYAPTPSLIRSTEKEAGTLDVAASRESARIPQASVPEHPDRTPFTPQDAIITQVFGKSVRPTINSVYATPSPPPSNSLQPSASLTTADPATTAQASRARPGPTLTIYDPFSGVKLGGHTPMSPLTATPGKLATPTALPTADDCRLWSSLERILELQAEIAAMHADMEGVGGRGTGANPHAGGIASEGGNARGSRKRMRRGQTLPVGDEEPEEHEHERVVTGIAASEISTDRSDGEDDDDDDDDDDMHGHGKRRRDEEFTRLAEQFAQRKAAIGGIMNKLDALSTALKTFHTLPPPLFDLAVSPRTDTMSSDASAASSPPPLHVYPVQPVPSAHPITPTTTPPPLVPPISTLVTSGDPSAPLGVSPVVAPALPRMASPMILPGTPHVESPADMDHAQSIFRRVP